MFSNRKGYKIFHKPFYEYFNLYWFNLRTIESSDEKKNQEDLKNGIRQALVITKQNNLLSIAFLPLVNGAFGFSTDMRATIMVQTMRDFITKNSNLSLKIVCVAVNNIQQVKMFTKLSWQIICDICAEEFLIFYCFILLNIRISKEI